MPRIPRSPRSWPRHALVWLCALGLILSAAQARAQGARWQQWAGDWEVRDTSGRVRGQISLGIGAALGGTGTLFTRDVFLETRSIGAEGVVLTVHRGIGDRSPAALMLSDDPPGSGRALIGTYAETGGWHVVRLERTAPPPPDDPVIDDLPGVGVSAAPYRLRNPPADGWVPLYRFPRVDPSRDHGRLWRGIEELLVLECLPEVDAYRFETANRAGRRRILDSLWCLIDWTDTNGTGGTGWIEGRHLEPMWERIGPVP